MNTVTHSRKLVMYMSASLLLASAQAAAAGPTPSTYTYSASNMSVRFTNSVGHRGSLDFQQCNSLSVPANTTNARSVNNASADTDAFGIALLQVLGICSVNVQSGNAGNSLLSANLNSAAYYFLQDTIEIGTSTESLSLQSAGGGLPPYTLTDNYVTSVSGVPMPVGPFHAGDTFHVSVPLTITTDAGTTETDIFTGKMVLGEVQALRNHHGAIIGSRFIAIRICGQLSASDGEKYEINQNISQTDMPGVLPNQLILNFTFTTY